MKERLDYITLLHKSFKHPLSADDAATLDQWLSESEEHRQTADELKSVWNATGSYMSNSTPDLAKGLSRLRAGMEQDQEMTAVLTAKQPSKLRYLFRVAAAAALVAGMFFVWNTMDNNGSYEIVQTRSDEQTDLMLEDGSLVFLNESSKLEKPLAFDLDRRQVSLKGEAYFEVAKDASRPFVVSTKNVDIEVLGTAFNVYAPGKTSFEEVVVDHGKVRVRVQKTGETFILEKGDRLIYHKNTQQVDTSKDEKQNAQAWRTGTLDFEKIKLKDVIHTLEKYYDIKIDCKNKEMLNCEVSKSTFQNEEVGVVMQTIQTMFNFDLKHRKDSKTYKLYSGTCTN